MNKVVWITGASSGIGKSLALKFAKEGWNVAISARREKLLNEISESNDKIKAFTLDVTNKNDCEKVFENVLDKFKKIDLCIFATGTWDPIKNKDIDLNQIEDTFKVNFFGTLYSIKAVEKYFKDRGDGHISLISSIAGYRGLPASSGYGPSKAALNNLAESLYIDFKRFNVRVSLITPGFIKTPMTDKNQFKMPFIKSPEYAAEKIYKGLIHSKSFEIDFPKELTTIIKFFKFLPNKTYLHLIEKLTKQRKN